MTPQEKVDRLFNKFAGREVRMKTTHITAKSLRAKWKIYNSGPDFFRPYTITKPCLTDPTMLEMRFTAWAHLHRLFVNYPGHTVPFHAPFAPVKHRARRVRAGLEKDQDGKWRVMGGSFPLG
jgi:hypothetical protein